MTRRGTLAYYLAAWAVGSLSIAVALWVRGIVANGWAWESHHDFGLLMLSVDALLLGLFATLLIAFFLRRLMRALKWLNAPAWIAAGAILAPSLTWIFWWIDTDLLHVTFRSRFFNLNLFLLAGPAEVVYEGWWLAIPAGAATAYVLYRVERAFSRQGDAQTATPQQNGSKAEAAPNA